MKLNTLALTLPWQSFVVQQLALAFGWQRCFFPFVIKYMIPSSALKVRRATWPKNEGKAMKRLNLMSAYLAGLALLSSSAYAQDLNVDPQGSGVITNAMRWIQGTLLGSVATAAAVIAIAVVGFLMLSGRINWRHGAVVILGCFILFGAASIVAGIQATASLSEVP